MEWFPVTVRAHAYAACKVNVPRIIPSCNFYVKMVFTDFLLSWYNWRSLDSRDGDAIFYSQGTFVDTKCCCSKSNSTWCARHLKQKGRRDVQYTKLPPFPRQGRKVLRPLIFIEATYATSLCICAAVGIIMTKIRFKINSAGDAHIRAT